MLNKIIETLKAYRDTNKDVLSTKEMAEIESEICYVRVLRDCGDTVYKDKYHNLLDLTAKVLPNEKETTDKEISRGDFVNLWNEMVQQMFNTAETPGRDPETETAVHGHNVTIHWHGLYCSVSDGATVSNNIIEGINGVIDEIGEED